VVVWSDDGPDGSSFGVFGQRYASSGAPLAPAFRVNTYVTGYQGRPSVAADGSGNFVVVWASTQEGSSSGVFGQRYANTGGALGPEFRVNTYTTNLQRFSSVVSDGSGNFVVVWHSALQEGAGSSYGVFAQRFASSGPALGPEFRVNTFTTSAQIFPVVASDPSGNFIVTWEGADQDGSPRSIFGQRFSPMVPVELTRFGLE
jgi:hypothetical protein